MPDLDFEKKAELHKYFSVHCFNEAWKLIDKQNRTSEENDEMVHYALASLFHWSKRKDCTDRHKSIGCWQIARCYALTRNLEQAERYGKLCVKFSENEGPFYLGYAHEALARVHSIDGNADLRNEHLQFAKNLCDKINNKEEKEILLADLKTIT